jgi:hypothetical protein
MKFGCINKNRRVKMRVWLGNARHHPWLRNSEVNQLSAGRIMLPLSRDMKVAILVHLTPNGPDLSPSDFHIFAPIKEALRGRRF